MRAVPGRAGVAGASGAVAGPERTVKNVTASEETQAWGEALQHVQVQQEGSPSQEKVRNSSETSTVLLLNSMTGKLKTFSTGATGVWYAMTVYVSSEEILLPELTKADTFSGKYAAYKN